jgi:hypothetical protein
MSAATIAEALKLATDEQISAEHARRVGKLGGRPPVKQRCPCGAMSAKRAKARGHKCQ